MTVEEHRVPTRLGELAVRITGSGPVAVLWHGMFIDSTTWDDVVPALAAQRRLVLADGPGHGHSAPLLRRSSVEECVDVAAELLDGLGIEGPVDWVGNAWGGHVGLAIGMRGAPSLRSLVAIGSPTTPIAPALRTKIRALLVLLRIAGMRGPVRSAILGAQLTEASCRDPRIVRTVTDALARATPASLRLAVRSFILDRTDVTAGLPHIEVPALFIGTDDRGDWSAAESAAAAAAAPDARAAVIPGARVLAPLERPRETADALVQFWREVDQANAGATSDPTVRT